MLQVCLFVILSLKSYTGFQIASKKSRRSFGDHCKNQSYSEKLDLINMVLPDSNWLYLSQVKPDVPNSQFGNFRMVQSISESIKCFLHLNKHAIYMNIKKT